MKDKLHVVLLSSWVILTLSLATSCQYEAVAQETNHMASIDTAKPDTLSSDSVTLDLQAKQTAEQDL